MYPLFLLLFTHLTEDWSEERDSIKYTAINPVWITTAGTEVKPAADRKHGDKAEILSLNSLIFLCFALPGFQTEGYYSNIL